MDYPEREKHRSIMVHEGMTAAIKRCDGFTLIDLSILLMICAILVTPVLKQVDLHYINIRLGTTDSNMFTVKAAVDQYYMLNGSYPCPADPTLSPDDATYGASVAPCDTGADPVVGAVPFKDIRVPVSATLDGYKNKLTYAVSRNLVNPATFNNGGTLDLRQLKKVAGTPVTFTDEADTGGHFVLISHGRDGMGAYTADGNQPNPCVAGSVESENCDNDKVFLHHSYRTSDVTGANYFDDRTNFQYTSNFRVWQTSPADITDIFSSDAVYIGIGTKNPEVPLDVTENIRTQGGNTQATGFCEEDVDSTNCFSAKIIGGSGTGCSEPLDADPKSPMAGIQYGGATCSAGIPGLVNTSCPSGEMVTGIVGGVIQCGAP